MQQDVQFFEACFLDRATAYAMELPENSRTKKNLVLYLQISRLMGLWEWRMGNLFFNYKS